MELVVEILIVKVPPAFAWTPESKPPPVLQGTFKRAVASETELPGALNVNSTKSSMLPETVLGEKAP